MKKVTKIFVAVVCLLCAIGCTENTPRRVYVGGAMDTDEGLFAAIWIDGQVHQLCDKRSQVEALAVVGDDIYAAGWIMDDEGVAYATLWKNGQPVKLSSLQSTVTDIFADNKQVCVVGGELHDGFNEDGYSKALLWHNDKSVVLSPDTALAMDVFANGERIYVVGVQQRDELPEPFMWMSGAMQSPGDGLGSASNVILEGDDVYISIDGYSAEGEGMASIWKNGEKHFELFDITSNGASPYRATAVVDMVVVKGHVYAIGSGEQQPSMTAIWRDDKLLFPLGSGNEFDAVSIEVIDDNNIYVGSNPADGGAVVWHNRDTLMVIPNALLTEIVVK